LFAVSIRLDVQIFGFWCLPGKLACAIMIIILCGDRGDPFRLARSDCQGVADKGLPVSLTSPNTSHEDSDDCGAIILGMEEERPNWDMIGAKMNGIRTKTLLQEADVVVVRFGEKYRQWNAVRIHCFVTNKVMTITNSVLT
jgi:YtoQ family protein